MALYLQSAPWYMFSVDCVKGVVVMSWERLPGEAFYPGFKCTECGNVIVLFDECFMPDECDVCKKLKKEESTNEVRTKWRLV